MPILALPERLVRVSEPESSALLSEWCQRFPQQSGAAQISVRNTNNGLVCDWQRDDGVTLELSIEVSKFVRQQRSFPAPKQGAFNQALGRKTRNVVDATGGWGGDALLMCAQGYQVTILERHPLMALMLRDAMRRLAVTDWARANPVHIPQVVEVDAQTFFATPQNDVDCIYLDPMFPPKRKKSAASNKYMQFLQWLLPADGSAEQLCAAAFASGAGRVVVKRPDHAAPLKADPDQQISSKLVHYDAYLN